MQQFNIPELLSGILEDCCNLRLEPINIGFAETVHSVLMIGDDPDYPEVEIEVAYDEKAIKATIFKWDGLCEMSRQNWSSHDTKEFSVFTEPGLNKLISFLKQYCTNQNVKLQYFGENNEQS